ncbi:acyltransferase, partial [Rhizobium sp. Pop5]
MFDLPQDEPELRKSRCATFRLPIERTPLVSEELTRSHFYEGADPGLEDAAGFASRADPVKKHFVFLDELRGIAALSVVLLHASQIFGFRPSF